MLYSYRPSFALSYRHSPTVPGVAYLHLQEFYIWYLGDIIQIFPDLKAIFGASDPELSTSHPELISYGIQCLKYLEDRRIKLFGAKCDDDSFVNSDFLDFINSREPRS